ncbi:Fc receptor-like protein 4 isoform X2 [Sarcophilus harrisii]|uniref:Ig-like domain-containing protein n=1 Tax=Sarcophilus harrisii TaxID=9305 RepID=A0A7N4NTN4_SARHA|nr:Fc receptor-like protein 4 isoform X2 [Sarcophilus harrisii]
MLLWVLLLILGLLSRQAAIAKKSVVEPRPSWTPILEGEAVTLICHGVGPLKEERAWWYKNQQLRGILSTIIQTNHPGEYRCQTQGSTLSDPVNLVFSSDPLILQTPYSVFEGDTLVLRCRGKNTGTVSHMTYYKDKRKLRDLITDFDKFLSLSQVGLNDSSKYQCTRVVSSAWSTWRETSKNVAIQVQELFSPPELKTTTSEPIEGTPVNLSCETQLSPQRLDTKLYFSFTRDGMVITSSGKNSHVLQIPTIQTKDSGSYRCEAKAVTQNILKQSNYVKISVKIPVSQPFFNLSAFRAQASVGDVVEFHCKVLRGSFPIQYQFYHENTILENKIALSGDAVSFNLTMTVGHSGNYFCKANNSFSYQLSKNLTLSISGRSSTPNPYRVSSISDLQEPVYSNPSSQKELMPIYGNVNPVAENVVYSEVTSKEYGKEANNTKKLPEIEDSPVIYAEVKQKHQPRDSKKTNAADRRQDVAEN